MSNSLNPLRLFEDFSDSYLISSEKLRERKKSAVVTQSLVWHVLFEITTRLENVGDC